MIAVWTAFAAVAFDPVRNGRAISSIDDLSGSHTGAVAAAAGRDSTGADSAGSSALNGDRGGVVVDAIYRKRDGGCPEAGLERRPPLSPPVE